MDAGTLGGIIGGVVGTLGGIAGGAIGTYFSIKNTKGPKERAFMVKVSIVAWIGITGFLALLLGLPNPYRHLAWIPYGILLPLGIRRSNRIQQAIRAEESRASRSE